MPVQIISPSPRAMQQGQIGQALGIGINKNFPDPQQMVQRRQLQQALAEAKQSVRQPGATPLDKMFSFMEAGAGIPGSERYMGALLPLVQQLTQAEAAQNAPLGMPGQEGSTGQSITSLNQPELVENQLNNFLNPSQQNGFYPSNVGDQQTTGNLPQAATTGVKQPVASNQQLLKWSKDYAAQKTAAGIPTKPAEAYEELKAINADNQEANKLVEQERKERVASQREYGQIAENKLSNIMPDAGDEEKAYIKKQVEQLAGENASEADIERLASAEARKYKNMISKVSQDIPASRIYNRPFQNLMGTSKSAESARNDLKLKVKPLLDAGLYDKARKVLGERGYYPEEREMIITNLGEGSLKALSDFPDYKKLAAPRKIGAYGLELEQPVTIKQKEAVKQNLNLALKNDPSANLILLRKAYEDKGVDWRLFKDSLNQAIEDGIFKPNDDQFNQLNNLDQPPLNGLEKILHGIGIIGR